MEQTQSLQTRQEQRQFLRLEQANLLELPEGEFHRLIREVEESPLFKSLCQRYKLIRYHRFPRTDVASSFYELKEEVIADTGSLDVESLLLNKEHVVSLVRKLGLERFKRYFLYLKPEMTTEEIARECGLEVSEVQRINSFVDDFSILSEFYHPSTLSSEKAIRYSKIASVERGPEGFFVGYFSPSLARGRYSVDYERFEELKGDGTFTETGARQVKQLFRKLELINSRKDTLYRILVNIVEKQALYLESGDPKALLPFSQNELAKRSGLAPSSISRAIWGKSLDTPWGEEKPLKDFFPQPRRFRKDLIRQLLESEREPLSDATIKDRLDKEFGVSLSRRSVASLRKELKIAPAWKRGKNLPRKAEEA